MKNDLQSLSYMVSRYFRFYLPGERGFSMMTIISYRDTFKQFLSYCSEIIGKPPEKLCISDLSKESVAAFLTNLEASGKSISTRNQRLAAIKSFFNYVKYAFPEYLDVASGVLRMRMKKQPEATVNYMTVEGISCILHKPDLYTECGFRDSLMLTLMYDSGARVSEITDICIGDIRLQSPSTIILHGKGIKDRIVPLSSKTANLISSYLDRRKMNTVMFKDKLLFANRIGEHLTRAGVAYILKKYVELARLENPTLIPDKFSPHCMRHSKAMHLLQAGVALIYIRDFLGHNSVKTTEVYAKADGKSKRAALETAYASALIPSSVDETMWNDDASLMKFLTELCGN